MATLLSIVGERMNELSGVREIMADIMETLKTADPEKLVDLSAGNPLILDEVKQLWDTTTSELVGGKEFGEALGRYGPTPGYPPFVKALVADLNKEYGWNLTEKNVIVTPGSQFAYYMMFQVFTGATQTGEKGLLFPILPEYTGYSNMGIDKYLLRGKLAYIDKIGAHSFKYSLNLEEKDFENIGVVCFSRPTNPSGNVFTDEEVTQVIEMAKKQDALVVIDSAYSAPYPNLAFVEMTPFLGENVAHVMSFSKAGLPGERVGVVVASEDIIKKLSAFQANASIHSSRFGQMLLSHVLTSGSLKEVCKNVVHDFYQSKQIFFTQCLGKYIPDNLPYFQHQAEGTFFAWLWFEGLPLTDKELYKKLKQRGLVVVPGSFFFPGYKGESTHIHETIRLSLATTDEKIEAGVKILSQVLEEVYRG